MGWFLDFLHWWTTARIASTAAAIGGGVAVVTGKTAVSSLKLNQKATQRTTRPMLVATLKPTGTLTAGISITNAGQSIARKVGVTFDPPLPTHEQSSDGKNSIIPLVRRRFAKPIDAWAPGHTVRSELLICNGTRDDAGQLVNVDGIPRETSIVFAYEDDDKNSYTDRMSLDPTLLEGETWSVHKRNTGGEETIEHDGSPWLND